MEGRGEGDEDGSGYASGFDGFSDKVFRRTRGRCSRLQRKNRKRMKREEKFMLLDGLGEERGEDFIEDLLGFGKP